MRKIALGLCAAFLLASPALAQQGLRYASDERYAVVNDDAYNDLNVVMAPVSYEKLPLFIQNQLAVMANKCTENNENAYHIKVYSYESEGARRKKLPPSYILDTSPLLKETMKPCSYASLCRDGMCSLIGFRAIEPNTWSRSFASYVQSWEIKHRPFPGTTLQQTVFSVRAIAPRCPPDSTGAQPDECSNLYVWTGDRLSMLPQMKTTDPALTN